MRGTCLLWQKQCMGELIKLTERGLLAREETTGYFQDESQSCQETRSQLTPASGPGVAVCVCQLIRQSLSHSAALARQHILVSPVLILFPDSEISTRVRFHLPRKDEQTRRWSLQEHQFNRPGTSLSFQTLMASDGWKCFVHNYKQFATQIFSNSGATATSNWC